MFKLENQFFLILYESVSNNQQMVLNSNINKTVDFHFTKPITYRNSIQVWSKIK